ncbi:MAG: class I SAM-dependent methyltransferase [Myxococcales bacterium]|nr:class I SAM-dependent methyltransferase [Myxococcales bacterium]
MCARARELARGSADHYLDPLHYVATYRGRRDDVRYYHAHARALGGPVLEYGCGAGRIALPLARVGLEVTGVDASAQMLGHFRQTLAGEPRDVRARVRLRRGDMRGVRLAGRFPLVLCTFNSFLHLYTRRDVERFLARVAAHLAPGGTFVFDVSLPVAADLARAPDDRHHAPRFRHGSTGELVRYSERFDYDPLDQVLLVHMRFEPLDAGRGAPRAKRPRPPWETVLAHRQFYPQELEALLHYNGFAVTTVHGDFTLSPPTRDSGTLVYHCARRRAGAPTRTRQTPM